MAQIPNGTQFLYDIMSKKKKAEQLPRRFKEVLDRAHAEAGRDGRLSEEALVQALRALLLDDLEEEDILEVVYANNKCYIKVESSALRQELGYKIGDYMTLLREHFGPESVIELRLSS